MVSAKVLLRIVTLNAEYMCCPHPCVSSIRKIYCFSATISPMRNKNITVSITVYTFVFLFEA